MGIDLQIGDTYFIVGRVPLAVGVLVLSVAILFGAWKVAKSLWLMLG